MSYSKRSKIAPFYALKVFEEANKVIKSGKSVIHLSLGEPGSKTPYTAIKGAKEALDNGSIGYTEPIGTLELRKLISKHYKRFYNIEIPISMIAVTSGSSAAFVLGFLTLFDLGDKVAISSPSYPCYINILTALGIEVLEIEAKEDHNFQLSKNLIETLPDDVKGLIVSSPANPTGAVINREEFFEISKLCKNRNIKLVSDEIYHGINYDTGNLFSALNFDKDAIVINSFSKYFSMTGWRLGWIIMPEDGIESLSKLAMNMYLSPSYVSQCAAKRVFEDYKILNSYVNQYRINRDILLNGLKKAGIDKFTFPRGAFYIYADISHLHNDSEKFCNKMLHEAGVASVPGIDFDKNRGKKFVRFSYSGKENEVLEASKRILNWLK